MDSSLFGQVFRLFEPFRHLVQILICSLFPDIKTAIFCKFGLNVLEFCALFFLFPKNTTPMSLGIPDSHAFTAIVARVGHIYLFLRLNYTRLESIDQHDTIWILAFAITITP